VGRWAKPAKPKARAARTGTVRADTASSPRQAPPA
jgi:hypothetical protein